ncbi:unnamed protein product [Urochloa decumbens]|uniref:Uncharacterized protein n=1 Tax=Urochloa decumbens TaxID=240449 RepID=A0ABC9EB00_9POAL
MAAALAIFAQMMMLVDDAAGLAQAHLRLPLRHRLLRYSAACMVLGASALFHAVAVAVAGDVPNDTLALAGFLLWMGGLALLLLSFTAARFPAASRLAAQLVEAAAAAIF